MQKKHAALFIVIAAASVLFVGCSESSHSNATSSSVPSQSTTTTTESNAISQDNNSPKEEEVTLDHVEIQKTKEEDKLVKMIVVQDVNIRDKDAKNSNVIGTLRKGEFVSAVSRDEYWTKIKKDGKYVYVYSPCLEVVSGKFQDEKNDETTDNSNDTKVGEKFANPKEMTLNTDANIRRGPSANAPIYKTITAGSKVKVLSKGRYWTAISMDGGTYYIHSPYIS